MSLSADFLFFLIEKIIISIDFWLPVIGLIHLLVLQVAKKRIWPIALVFSLLIFWVLAGHPLIQSIQNAGIDSMLELRAPDGREVIFWIETNLGSTLPDTNYIFLWSLISFFYLLIWFVLIRFFANSKFSRHINLLEKLIIAIMVIYIPLASVAEKRSALKIALNQLDITSKALSVDQSHLEVKEGDLGVPIFLYLGESTSSMNMGIYGYPRDTTPTLESFSKDNDNFIKIPNVWATHTHTIPSLLDVFSIPESMKNPNSSSSIFQRSGYPLIPILNSVGINTHIVANHVHEEFLSLVFNEASTLIVPKIARGAIDPYKELKKFDHEVLNEAFKIFESNENNKSQLYIFHSYAGHGDYRNFIPKKYHVNVDDFLQEIPPSAIMGNVPFKDVNFIESYDSAIAYIDTNIVKAINFVKQYEHPMIFIYFPDHGESVYTRRAHDSSKFTVEMAQIPMFVYFNDLAINKNPEKFLRMQQRIMGNKFATLSQIPSLIAEIMDIEILDSRNQDSLIKCSIGINDCQDSLLLVREVTDNKSVVKTSIEQKLDAGMIDATDDATNHYNLIKTLDIDASPGICYHRSNSIGKAIRGLAVTDCLEIDLVIEEGDLYIFHPPQENYGFKFSKLLEIIHERKVALWIDGKNIDNIKNCNTFVDKTAFFSNKNISLLIEFPSSVFEQSKKLENCIFSLKDLGFSTSYYVPEIGSKCSDHLQKGLKMENSEYCRLLINRINWVINTDYFSDISFDYSALLAISNIDNAASLRWNMWGLEPSDVLKIPLKKFNFIIPINSDPNDI